VAHCPVRQGLDVRLAGKAQRVAHPAVRPLAWLLELARQRASAAQVARLPDLLVRQRVVQVAARVARVVVQVVVQEAERHCAPVCLRA
jgi:hypothetical protein